MQEKAVERRTLLRTAALSLAMFAAGCAVVPKGPPKPVEPPPTQPKDQLPTLPTDQGRHRIALLAPMTGANADVGQALANAANLAALDTGGQRLRITVYNTAGGAVAAGQKAIADGNKLILGPLLSEDVRAVAQVARTARVPMLAFSNDVSVSGNGTYLLGLTPGQSISRVVGYARSKGATRFSALIPNNLYGQRAETALVRTVQDNGGQIVSVVPYERQAGSIMAAINKMAAKADVDAILIADTGRVAMQAVPIIRRGPAGKVKILGTELWNNEVGLTGVAGLQGAWFASVSDGYFSAFADNYRKRYGRNPARVASLAYDAVLLTNKVAATWRPGTSFPVSALDDKGGFVGVDGAFRFLPSGIAERALEVQEVRASGITVVAPAQKGFVN